MNSMDDLIKQLQAREAINELRRRITEYAMSVRDLGLSAAEAYSMLEKDAKIDSTTERLVQFWIAIVFANGESDASQD